MTCYARRFNSWNPYEVSNYNEVHNEMNLYHFFREVLRQFRGLRSDIYELNLRVAYQESKMAAIEETTKKIEDTTARVMQDVGNIQRAVTAQKQVVADLQAVVDALKAGGVVTPEIQARLDKAVSDLDQVDRDLDAVAPDETPVPLPSPTDDTLSTRPRVRR